jgi:cytochrome c-type biogenesis protein
VIALTGPSVPLAFLAGLASFLSPCVFPLVPVYAAYLGGRASAGEPVALGAGAGTLVAAGAGGGDVAVAAGPRGQQALRVPILGNGVAFVAGFMVVFIALFYVLQALEVTFLLHHQVAVNRVAGAVIIVLALQTMGVFRIPLLMRDWRFHGAPLAGGGSIGAFLLGITFALGWTPCIGAQLGAILQLAVSGDFGGLPFMLVYCAGLAVPFLIVAVLADRMQGVIRAVNQRMGVINIVAGLLLLGFGFLLISNEITLLNQYSFSAPFNL